MAEEPHGHGAPKYRHAHGSLTGPASSRHVPTHPCLDLTRLPSWVSRSGEAEWGDGSRGQKGAGQAG
jgi:hypothetical protein